MTSQRPDPDALLKAIDEQQSNSRRGKLRVFLGMSAGVGKTYSMLRAAHQRQKEGMRVIVGVVETHGRSETMALVEGLTVLARREIDYKGTLLQEMDLDSILSIHPDLVVVDELAHTNIPGSRHEKRYQDVIEILDAGIDVYTALNVQHLESRKDSVESITGIQIRETVPDSILERATLVELVDIAPSELLKRLSEGKVYLGDKAERAAQNFFKEDKLTALREIALRMTAERVDQDLQKFGTVRVEGVPWQTNERLLVAISHSPYSEKLIRATRRLAYNLEAPWVALHVNTGLTLNDADQAQLAKNLNLARELNAEVITTTEVDVPSAVRRICHNKNVTQVVVGRPTRRWIRDIFERGNLLERLLRDIIEVDVHIIRQEREFLQRPSFVDELMYYRSKRGVSKYGYTVLSILATALIGTLILPFIGYRAVGFIFLLTVLIVGMFGSLSSVVLGAGLSTLVWDYFFIPPKYTFAINNAEDFLMCVAFFVVASITGFLANRIRFHEKVIREREEKTTVLYEILQIINTATDKADFLKKSADRVAKLFEADCGILLKSRDNKLLLQRDQPYSISLSENDQAVAQWAFENNRRAGWGTDTLAQSSALFIPLAGPTELVGVFVLQPKNKNRKLDLDQENLLSSIVRQIGAALERHFLSKRLAEAQRLKDSEELHQTLLNSISHEMRTPLTAILNAASSLQQDSLQVSDQKKMTTNSQAIIEIQDAGERLNRVIENLLDMSRLNSGVLALKRDWVDVHDLFGVVISKTKKHLLQHDFKSETPDEVCLVKVDFRLLEHALSNILINATMYTPIGSKIVMRFYKQNLNCIIEIEDSGAGIPLEAQDKIFDKFYRIPGTQSGGTGLGLSISKSIVEFHGGSISATNVSPHGAKFAISLPLEETISHG